MEQKKREALSIPNLITYFRLILVPVFVLAYFEARYVWALVVLIASGLTDVADGYIARHYNMVTDLGKVIDPVADKLTQAAMIFCVAWHIPTMWILLAFLVVKELVMLFMGWLTIRRTGTVNSAKWYGKVCTAVLYASMALLVLWPDIPIAAANIITIVCGGMMLMSIVLYCRWYIRFLRAHDKKKTPIMRHGVIRSQTSVVVTEIVIVVILVSAVLAYVYRNDLTLENIVSFTPENLWLAALVFMGLFAAKSVTVVVYQKLLYIAAGVVFPLPVAVAVSIAGTIVEFTIPYVVGHFGGKGAADLIVQRRPKLRAVSIMQGKGAVHATALLRAVGIFPADPLSLYLGARGMPYGRFLLGGLLGQLPTLLITTVMGVKVQTPGSPGFIIATVLFVAIQVAAGVLGVVWIRKNRSRKGEAGDEPAQ